MKAWLLLSIPDEQRLYQGHHGYADDLRSVYRYDSLVPNHGKLSVGDIAVLRGKHEVVGIATIMELKTEQGVKQRLYCPSCGLTKIKSRKTMTPKYRCECGSEFDSPRGEASPCTLYHAFFGNSFVPSGAEVSIQDLWGIAIRLNKQLAMLELDMQGLCKLLRAAAVHSPSGDELPAALSAVFEEGQRYAVLVDRYERDRSARLACIKHHKPRCVVCGFDFGQFYGQIGEGVIEVHHLELLSNSASEHKLDPIADLRPVCSNCHTIIHKRNPPFSPDEVRAMIQFCTCTN